MNPFICLKNTDSDIAGLKHVGKKPVEELQKECEADDKCVGFNTNGCLKYKISDKLIYSPDSDLYFRYNYEADNIINTFFDKILIINLEQSRERWESTVEQLKKHNITNYERFDAIDSKKALTFGWKIPTVHKNRPRINFEAQLGCKLSHYHAIKLAKEKGYKNVLIMEDDLIFKKENLQRLKLTLRQINEWNMLYIFGIYGVFGPKIANCLYKIKYQLSCACYAVNSNSYDFILKTIEKQQDYPIDDLFSGFVHPHLKLCYAIYPWTISPDLTNKSTITFT